MFRLFSNKKEATDASDAQKLAFRDRFQRSVEMIAPLSEKAAAYSKELGRRKPKEFWIESSEIRVFLGTRRNDTNYDVYEEVIWVHYDVDNSIFSVSVFRGMRGDDKMKETKEIETADEVFDFIKNMCETYFEKHTD